MKRVHHLSNVLALFLVALFILSGCESKTLPQPTAADSVTPPPASNSIHVTGSVTISRNDLYPLTEKQEYLSVVLTNGKYYEDWFPGPLMGRTWEGEFQIQLSSESGEVKSSFVLNDYFHESVLFNSFFDIMFDDYNEDGNLDFTIGQYASSNGSIFKLFTLLKTGEIAELPIKDHSELFMSGTGRYSTELTKTNRGFSSTYYDNSIGKEVKQTFIWNGNEFVSDNE